MISTEGQGDGKHLQKIAVRAQVWVRDLFGFVDVSQLENPGQSQVENEEDAFFEGF